MTAHANEPHARSLYLLRVGNRWFIPAHIVSIEMTPAPAGSEQPGAKVTIAGSGMEAHSMWEFSGAAAEAVLEAVGYGKDAREAEATAKLKAIHDAEQAKALAEAEATAKKAEPAAAT